MIHLSHIPGGVEFQLWFLKTTMIGARMDMLAAMGRGFRETGIDLVGIGYAGVESLQPAPYGDDVGLYVLAVRLADLLGTNLAETLFAIMLASVGLGLAVSIGLVFLAFRSVWARLYATGVLLLLNVAAVFVAGDFYMVTAPATTVVATFALALARRGWRPGPGLLAAVFAVGVMGGTFDLMRGHAAIGALVFLAGVLIAHPAAGAVRRLASVAVLAAGVALPVLTADHLVARRDAYLAERLPAHERSTSQNLVWHTVYIGFGFLNNPYGVRYADDVAYDRAREIDPEYFRVGAPVPNYYSARYESVMRQAAVEFVLAHPFFVLKTLFAKAGTMVLYFLIFANLGAVFLLFRRRPWRLEAAAWSGILVSSVVGLISMPNTNYILSFLALIVVYAIACVGWETDDKGWRAICVWRPEHRP